MEEREWYSVRSVFEQDGLAHEAGATVYEERVVILRAASLDDAIERGEAEAQEYADVSDGSRRYAGFIDAYRTGETRLSDRMEVYSLMRETALPRAEFITRYYDDGTERSQRYGGGTEEAQQ